MYLAENIRFLRKKHKITQQELAEKLAVKRSVIGAYEEGRADPKLPNLIAICRIFNVSTDALLLRNIANDGHDESFFNGENLRVLPVVVKQDNEETIPLVPQKAAAGYLNGYGDPLFVGNLPQFAMPFPELADGSYRIFQVKGDSMPPVRTGAYLLARYVSDWLLIPSERFFVLVTSDEGIVFKQVINHYHNQGKFLLKSTNPSYPEIWIEPSSIKEVWEVKGHIHFEIGTLMNQDDVKAYDEIKQQLLEIKQAIYLLKEPDSKAPN